MNTRDTLFTVVVIVRPVILNFNVLRRAYFSAYTAARTIIINSKIFIHPCYSFNKGSVKKSEGFCQFADLVFFSVFDRINQ